MTTLKHKELLDEYYHKLAPLAETASLAFGSRSTDSPEHDISRAYTNLLVEFDSKGGSLLDMADALGVTYPALRRRVMTAELVPLPRGRKSRASAEDYEIAVAFLHEARELGSASYHRAIKIVYDNKISLNKLAGYLGIKSAYPLYYGLSKARLEQEKLERMTAEVAE